MLLPELDTVEIREAATRIGQAVRAISFDADVLVMLTPHSSRRGVYTEIRGDLSAFGVPGIEAKAETDDAVARGLHLPPIGGGIDHGVLVPLLLGAWDVPVVAVGVDDGTALDIGSEARVAVIASVNLSAGLSPRAPLTEIPGASDAEARFVETLTEDVARAAERVPPGSCAEAVIRVFARTFKGRRARVLAHEAPVGVGYLVAEVE